MTREKEDELLAELKALRERMRHLIQQIVDARMAGDRDEEAIDELSKLSRKENELTRPEFETEAA